MRLFWILLTALLGLGGAGVDIARAADSNTKVQLVLDAEAARPGDTVWAGIRMTMAPKWHVYWRNPGESGVATSIEWQLPPGVTAGEIRWPPPEILIAGGMTTYVQSDTTMLLVPLTLAKTLPAGTLNLKAKVAWLECDEACLPGEGSVAATLAVGSEARASKAGAEIETWRRRVPTMNPALTVTTEWVEPPTGDTAELVIRGKSVEGFVPTDFLPYSGEQVEMKPSTRTLPSPTGTFALVRMVKRLEANFPAALPGILIAPGAKPDQTRAFEIALSLPGGAASPAGGSAPALADQGAGQAPASIWILCQMLGLAFLGGLILNVMPCVLPVIALKILGFVQQSKEEPKRVRQLGLLYALGVLVSFLVLAGFVIAVQKAGDAASWGMQMQNPYFRLALTVIVLLVALNLFGLFEVTLSGGTLGAAAGLASKEGGTGAFFNGVLATALATPCTAPFLTVALGFAFTQPPFVIVLMFVATACGLASPYVVLSWKPGWLKFLPRPGTWMVRFKVAMGFPMLGTAIWMFDLAAPSYGDGGVLWIGLFLVIIALAAWVWGEFVQRGTRRQLGAAIGALLLAVGGYFVALESQLNWRHPVAKTAGSDVVKDLADGIEWHRWSATAVQQARAAGKVVLVDFTARWCLTCKANKKFFIDIPSVRTRMGELNAIAFRADYTDKDPLIAQEFRRYGRAGVPLVLVFPRDPKKEALVLPTQLSPGIMLEALTKAGS